MGSAMGTGMPQGALAGLIATAPMTVAMELMRWRLPVHERGSLPPKKVALRAAKRVGLHAHLDDQQRGALALVSHFGFGAAAGSLYAPLVGRVGLPPVVRGVIFGLLIWLVNYMGWLPAVQLFGPATRDSKGRLGLMVAAHVVWGATLGLLLDRVVPHRRPRNR
jgi:uncharacterized membrane protein YagU involved in acid resistance